MNFTENPAIPSSVPVIPFSVPNLQTQATPHFHPTTSNVTAFPSYDLIQSILTEVQSNTALPNPPSSTEIQSQIEFITTSLDDLAMRVLSLDENHTLNVQFQKTTEKFSRIETMLERVLTIFDSSPAPTPVPQPQPPTAPSNPYPSIPAPNAYTPANNSNTSNPTNYLGGIPNNYELFQNPDSSPHSATTHQSITTNPNLPAIPTQNLPPYSINNQMVQNNLLSHNPYLPASLLKFPYTKKGSASHLPQIQRPRPILSVEGTMNHEGTSLS